MRVQCTCDDYDNCENKIIHEICLRDTIESFYYNTTEIFCNAIQEIYLF